jgi:Bacterial proteasome activator
MGEDKGMTEAQPENREDGAAQTVVVVGPDGRPVGTLAIDPAQTEESEGDPARLVEQPAKVMRIGSMIKQLLEEVRAAPLDEAGRARLKEIHHRSIVELEEGLAPELREELDRLSLPFSEEGTPSEPELRIAQAQLVGWLEGLFHGIQAALVAQQMATRMQLEQIRRTPALPMGHGNPFGQSPQPEEHPGQVTGTGQYL